MRLRHSLTLAGTLLLGSVTTGCGEGLEPESTLPEAPAVEAPGSGAPGGEALGDEDLGTAESPAVATTGVTADFRQWLSNNGYADYDFVRADVPGGSYGGRASGTDTVVNQPVIFIHGNSDKAVGTGTAGQTGWNASIEHFHSKGYKTSELYATTWGPASALSSASQYHSKAHVMKVRKFIEAVKAYTGAAKVDIVTHSMGVTLARKAILGGWANDSAAGGDYYVGAPLTSSVDTFVGIAGANLGLTSCYQTGPTTPTCGSTNGLYPGYLYFGVVTGRSAYLNNLRSTSGYEGAHRYSIYSTADEVIGYGGVVYGDYTSRIPGQTGEKVYSAYPYGHFNSKDLTAAVQYSMVRSQVIP
ncbi:lipase family protein [Pyxidicoccus xibeiensis]|uniref:lipase family protein n=1 Tax=Pyxidicoccus xibeiensis TaxID=2906759 RepID=UPI0020A77834|nr:lipase family protein [Pyxidicoccus xibeiensis]MCP3136778.1 lipase family protein [Pyxidicoccus xibeiensis]